MKRRTEFFAIEEAVMAGYDDLAAGRIMASTGDFHADRTLFERKEAEGWV